MDVAGVPPVTRAVLLLRFRDGLSRKQIAQELTMTERQTRLSHLRTPELSQELPWGSLLLSGPQKSFAMPLSERHCL